MVFRVQGAVRRVGLFREVGAGEPPTSDLSTIIQPPCVLSTYGKRFQGPSERIGKGIGAPRDGLSWARRPGPFCAPLPRLGCFSGAKTRARGPQVSFTYTPGEVKEWLVKGGGQLENKQVVIRLSDWSPSTLPRNGWGGGGKARGGGGVLLPVTCSSCA